MQTFLAERRLTNNRLENTGMGIVFIYSLSSQDGSSQSHIDADRMLANRAAGGDRRAFQQIVDSHKQRMFSVARSVIRDPVMAEDVVQEAFIKAYRALPDFRGDSRLSTWLFRIAYLSAIDMRRQQQRQHQIVDALQLEATALDTPGKDHAETSIANNELRCSITTALDHLSPFEQTVFTLRHLQNFKLREIALVVDRSEGTVKNILFRAIHKMRDQLLQIATDIPEIEIC